MMRLKKQLDTHERHEIYIFEMCKNIQVHSRKKFLRIHEA